MCIVLILFIFISLEGADDVKSSSLHIQTENVTAPYSAFVRWEEPKDPNGVIVAYILEYHRRDADHVSYLKILFWIKAFFSMYP